MKNKKRNRGSFFKNTLIELVGEVVWNILLFIPRLIIRIISSIW
ncbi:YqzE-like protein [Mesobacillus thioparans]